MRCFEWAEVRRKCQEESSLEGKEIKNTIVITFAFQIVFTAFNALQNLHSSLHDEESLGLICLSILYFTAIISSVLSPTIIGLIGAKAVLVAYFLAHAVYVLANFYPSFATMVPAAIALGAFNGPAWTSQALYISANAYSFSKSSSASPYSILSRFNGFFFAMFATTQIVGNLVTSTVIRDGVGNKSEEVFLFKYCGIDDCPYYENATQIEDPEAWVIDITLGFFMACALFGLLLVFFLLTPLPKSDWIQKVTIRSTTTSCFSVLLTTDMILLVPFMLFTSVEHAFLMATFTKAYVTCAIGIHMVGYVMAAYGATTPIFVFLFARLARIAGRFLLLTISMFTHIVLFIILFRWSPDEEDEALIFVIPMVWGVAESILLAQANSLITMLFPAQKEPAFANFHAWRSMGYCITFVNATYLCVSTKLILCIICSTLGLVLYVIVEIKTRMREKLVFEARDSIVSLPPSVTVDGDTISSTTTKRTSVSSFRSIQERLSFDHVELADVIKEAQMGWRRDEDGLTLEVSKVMSTEYLRACKATQLYHTRPVSIDMSSLTTRPYNRAPALPRSLSDGHMPYASPARRDTNRPLPMRSQSTIEYVEKVRHVSDIVVPSFDIIPEDILEDLEDDFIMHRQKDYVTSDDVFHSDPSVDHLDVPDSYELESDEPPPGFKKKSFLRRLSATIQGLHDDSSSRRSSDFELEVPAPSGSQSPENGHVNAGFVPDDVTDSNEVQVVVHNEGRKSSMTLKYTPRTSSTTQRHVAFENNRNAQITPTAENSNQTGSNVPTRPVTENGHAKPPKTERSVSSESANGKQKRKILGIKFHSAKKTKQSNGVGASAKNGIVNGGYQSQESVQDKGDDSGADSDGFVPEDQVVPNDTSQPDILNFAPTKKKNRVPIMESEDVNCIY
ncbi:uncharacterized protein LOC131941910 [Physella acuta]|uniref:uncharacterized protein LOC131941910 n=1 Tax=Physella acuta TaxID=109671 RepID=UPI0027DDE9C6|nr:uncharacterized protein LOC131941910 [Physella acuta]XP_059157619.1 uncharacterized protein LOC131941910 [Physella acuta]XP_059157697.1 uncharacterized protein LOC131941910 [Physella acuta]XP_059157782.1 uncharacterized protein LOC131941910 [Physella acuta]XP_059157854.1 uncharacterized protein LOC131941910 [Physella acuta]XP_059157923.1 uncharacterized protein LOC131941910 [Physella acuta]